MAAKKKAVTPEKPPAAASKAASAPVEGKLPSKAFTGMLQCGVVTVPIILYTGAREIKIELHHHHAGECGGKLKQLGYFCASCQGIDPKAEKAADLLNPELTLGEVRLGEGALMKAYEDGENLLEITDEEINAMKPESAKVMEILAMVPADQVDPITFEASYYLAPDTAGAGQRGFAIIRQAMVEDGNVAVAKLVKGKREHIVFIRPYRDDGMVAHTAYMADEIKAMQFPSLPATNPLEVKAAKTLFAAMQQDWNPSEYRDTYRENVLQLIESKRNKTPGPKIVPKKAPQQSQDFMSAFTATLELVKAKKKKGVAA